MKVTILGSGSAYGTPMAFNNWGGIINKENPKNQRTRASVLLETEGKTFLFDMGPDFRQQMNQNNVQTLDSIFITHPHYDHIGGLGDLWRAAHLLKKILFVNCSKKTLDVIKKNNAYMFDHSYEDGSNHVFWSTIKQYQSFITHDVSFLPFPAKHKEMTSTGFRHRGFAYLTDWEELNLKSRSLLKNLDFLVLECNNGTQKLQNGHSNLNLCLELIAEVKPKRTVLTHISARVDHDELSSMLPDDVEVGYDGMVIEF
ncbi:MAG: MBL fold metallo-hydrolase [Alphaproteobacteria bacterium]